MAEVHFSTCDTHMEPFSKRAWVRFEDYYTQRKLCVEMLAAFEKYVEYHGACHEEDCPEDDTCNCAHKPINDAVNAAIRRAQEVLNG